MPPGWAGTEQRAVAGIRRQESDPRLHVAGCARCRGMSRARVGNPPRNACAAEGVRADVSVARKRPDQGSRASPCRATLKAPGVTRRRGKYAVSDVQFQTCAHAAGPGDSGGHPERCPGCAPVRGRHRMLRCRIENRCLITRISFWTDSASARVLELFVGRRMNSRYPCTGRDPVLSQKESHARP